MDFSYVLVLVERNLQSLCAFSLGVGWGGWGWGIRFDNLKFDFRILIIL